MYWYSCKTFSKSYLHVKGSALIQCINSILTLLPSPNVIEVIQWWPLLNEFFWHCSKPGIAEILSFQLTHSGTKTHIHLLQHIISISEWLRFRFSRILKWWVQLSTPYSEHIGFETVTGYLLETLIPIVLRGFNCKNMAQSSFIT